MRKRVSDPPTALAAAVVAQGAPEDRIRAAEGLAAVSAPEDGPALAVRGEEVAPVGVVVLLGGVSDGRSIAVSPPTMSSTSITKTIVNFGKC